MRTKKQRKGTTAAARKTAGTYWMTPRVWRELCSHCDAGQAVAVRPRDYRYACTACIERLGIRTKESRAWRDGGARAGAEVKVRYLEAEL